MLVLRLGQQSRGVRGGGHHRNHQQGQAAEQLVAHRRRGEAHRTHAEHTAHDGEGLGEVRVVEDHPADADEEELLKMVKLAQFGVFTSQGIPFIFCGEEMFRSKHGEKNTYNMPDKYNAIDWNLKHKYNGLVEYYKGLIALRKAHPAFHMGDAELVRENVHFLPVAEGVVAYQLNGEAVGDSWKTIIVVLNGQEKAAQVALPAGEFHYACVDGKCPADMATVVSGTLRVAPQSAAIVYCL